MVNPNLEAILTFLYTFIESTKATNFIYAAFMIAMIGYGWCMIWKGIKCAGDVIRSLKRANSEDDWQIH